MICIQKEKQYYSRYTKIKRNELKHTNKKKSNYKRREQIVNKGTTKQLEKNEQNENNLPIITILNMFYRRIVGTQCYISYGHKA